MVKKITYAAVLLVAATLVYACTDELLVDEPTNRQMVLNAEPSAGNLAFVNFAYTRFFLDSSYDHPVDGAQLTLTVNGVSMQPDSMSRCNYYFPHTFAGGDTVGISITTPSGQTVGGQTTIPLKPDVTDVRVRYQRTPIFNFIRLDFNFSDHADIGEIYSISVQVRDSGIRYNEWKGEYDTVDTIGNTYFCLPQNPDITASNVCPYNPLWGAPFMLYSSRIMFFDNNIAGRQNYPVHVQIPVLRDTNEVQPFKHEYIVRLQSVTPERYRYIISVSSQSSATSFFAEQGQTYGNVQGGLGVFAGSAGVKLLFSDDTIIPTQYQSLPPADEAALRQFLLSRQ